MRLRPHHICCIRFWDNSFSDRGAGFLKTEDKIKETVRAGSETRITTIEGADELCRQCPLCVSESCASPRGGETEVRKWDAILLRELELPYNTCLSAAEWRKLIDEKIPFKLCQKCQWRETCRAGKKLQPNS